MKYFLIIMLSVVSIAHASSSHHKHGHKKSVKKKIDKECPVSFENYCARVEFLKKASRSYSSDFKIFFSDKKTKKKVIPSEKFSAYLWMNMGDDHSHGSSPVKIEKKKDHYLVSNVWFVMIGEWELHLSLQKGKAAPEKKTMTVEIGK